MEIEQVFHMVGGDEETSYANNSKLQEKSLLRTRPLVKEALKKVCNTLYSEKLVVADLGCSSGSNTFLVISEINDAVDEYCRWSCQPKPEIQFFLNDLPHNDFNNIFRLMIPYKKRIKEEKGEDYVSFYIAGLPGSFYRRLFPSKSVHFFHSSYCLMWLSQVPIRLEASNGAPMNRRNIYIGEGCTSIVPNLYLEQFKSDFKEFLKSRSKELIFGGRMVLSFLGRRNESNIGEHTHLWGLLARALNTMVSKGLLEEAKVDDFNMPFYTPLMEEVKSIIEMEGSFQLYLAEIFESNWDPFDDSIDNIVVDKNLSGQIVAKYMRAIVEPLLVSHFGDEIMEDLFSHFAKNITRHMDKGEGTLIWPLLEEAITEVCSDILPKKLVVADLGCSSASNTFLVISEINDDVDEYCRQPS